MVRNGRDRSDRPALPREHRSCATLPGLPLNAKRANRMVASQAVYQNIKFHMSYRSKFGFTGDR